MPPSAFEELHHGGLGVEVVAVIEKHPNSQENRLESCITEEVSRLKLS